MKTKRCLYPQPNHLLFRTAIEAEILFAVCVIKKQALTGGKSLACEDKCSKKIGAESAVPILVYFYIIMINKYRQSAKRKLLLNKSILSEVFPLTVGSGKTMAFENRRGKYKEIGKKVPLEYTPYGELWTYKSKTAMLFLTAYNNFLAKQTAGLIEEVAAGLDKLPFRFTGKELHEETGLYYYGARYLDPKYSRWLSGDPALNDYIPKAPIDDDSKKHNENLPGLGGVYNTVNLHVYHYAGNNPVKYTDPDGKASILSRRINSSGTNKAYRIASKLGKLFEFAKHSLVDYGEFETFNDSYGMVHHLGSNKGIVYKELINVDDREYTIRYTNMYDDITNQAVENVLDMERFGGRLENGKHNNDSAKQKYKILINDCNAFTRAVFKEYKKLWKENWKKENKSTSRYQAWKAWREHYKEITKRRGEKVEIKP